MSIRLLVLLLLVAACRSGEIACPEQKSVKLRKKPGRYLRVQEEEVTASAEDRKPTRSLPAQKKMKTIGSIEEWDCPRPGANVIPKSVKENIKKNRKKFQEANKQHTSASDTTARTSPNR